MDTVEITVEGYFNIIVSVLRSVAFLFQGNIIGGITACVALLYFLMMMFRSSIDDKQPSPFKELILIMFLGIMFVGGTSAKLTVQLTQQDNLSSYAEVQGVPWLIAFPYYVANRATNILKDDTKSNMLPVELASFDDVDPLQSISKLYYQSPPRTLLNGGNNSQGGYDIQRTMNAYFEDCVKVDNMLTGAPATSSIMAARKAKLDSNFFSKFAVNYDGFETTIYLTRGGSDSGEQVTCPDAHAAITNELQGSVFNEWVQFNSDSGITSRSVQKGLQLITGAITTGADAYDLQVGLFAARLVREGLIKSGFETELDMMIFQGQQQRMFSKLGERSMFENITKPVITLFELLIFFLTPIYTILLALGSKGLAHIGKYFMLIVFVSLWSYMNIFIDVFTYYIIDETIHVSNGFNPLSFDEMPITMSEVESAIATAASASQSVPFLLMFLMYGGVHSLMGAMRGLTDVKANGNFGAPTITSPANNGSRDVGNQNITKSVQTGGENINVRGANNDFMQSINASGTISSASNTAVSNAESRVNTASQNFNTSMSDLASTTAQLVNSHVGSESMQLTQANVQSVMDGVSNQIQSQFGISAVDADKLAAQVTGSLGGKIPSTDTGLKASLSEDSTRALSKNAGETEAFMSSLQKQVSEQLGLTNAQGETISFTDQDAKVAQASLSNVASQSVALAEAQSYQESVASTIGQGVNISSSSSLNFADYQSLGTFSGSEVLNSMMTRENGEQNSEFADFLMQTYGTTDFKDIKDKGIATDINTPSALNDGKGTDAGVLNRVFSDFTSSRFNAGDESGIEEKLEALRLGAQNMADQASGTDIGNQAQNFANTIERQEDQFEKLIEDSAKSDPTMDLDKIKEQVTTATSGTEDAVNAEMTPSTQGINSEGAQATIAGMDTGVSGRVEAGLAGQEEFERDVKNKLVNPTSGLASAGAEFFSGIFGESLKDFQYGSAGERLYDFIKEHNRNEVEQAAANGTTPDLLDTRMFDKLDSVVEQFGSKGSIEGVRVGDLMESYMALDAINQNIDGVSQHMDADTLDRYGKLYSKLDSVFNPADMEGKSDTERAFTLKSQDDYQTFKAVSGLVANGQMEASSGIFAMQQLVGSTTGYDNSAFSQLLGASATDDLKIRSGDGFEYSMFAKSANGANDLINNAAGLKEALNSNGVTSKDDLLTRMQSDISDTNNPLHNTLSYPDRNDEALRVGDAVFGAANYAYSQREHRSDFMAGAETEGLSENSVGENRQQGYQQLLNEYVRMMDGKGSYGANLEANEGELSKEKLLKDNLSELQQISSLYGGNVMERYTAGADGLRIHESGFNSPTKPIAPADIEYKDNPATGFKEIDTDMMTNGKLMLTNGTYELAGRRMMDNEDVGQLFYDSGTKSYMAMEYGKMRYYDDNPNKM